MDKKLFFALVCLRKIAINCSLFQFPAIFPHVYFDFLNLLSLAKMHNSFKNNDFSHLSVAFGFNKKGLRHIWHPYLMNFLNFYVIYPFYPGNFWMAATCENNYSLEGLECGIVKKLSIVIVATLLSSVNINNSPLKKPEFPELQKLSWR